MTSSLYSAFIVDANMGCPPQWELFGYGVSQYVCGTTIIAQRSHTNVPRGSYAGLPMGWDAIIDHWRALTSIRFAEPVLEWASQLHATFRASDKVIERRPLIDLLMASQNVFEPIDQIRGEYRPPQRSAFWLRENLSYAVEIVPENTSVNDKLCTWLVEHAPEPRLTTWIFLEGVIREASH